MLRWFQVAWILLFVSCSNYQTQNPNEQRSKNKREETIKLVFVGDLLLDRGVREKIEHVGVESIFSKGIDSVFKSNDIVVANLECPVTKIQEPINKKFIFRAEPEWLSALKKHGVSHLNLANNHSMDQGRGGLIDTERNIHDYGLISLGFGENENKACQPFLLANFPRKIFLLSSVQVPSENWTYLPNQPCVCENSYDSITKQITDLKSKDPDCVVMVQFHWGNEHVVKPTTQQKKIAHAIVDAGADCIIGHHPHVIQTIETYKGKSIFYSIGNFIFDQKKAINTKGLLLQMEITESEIKEYSIPFKIENCTPYLDIKDVCGIF